jgi:hypothetical protein
LKDDEVFEKESSFNDCCSVEILDDIDDDYYEENDLFCIDNGEEYLLDDLDQSGTFLYYIKEYRQD